MWRSRAEREVTLLAMDHRYGGQDSGSRSRVLRILSYNLTFDSLGMHPKVWPGDARHLDPLEPRPKWVLPPEVGQNQMSTSIYDFSIDEWRRVQHSHGYQHIFTNGLETSREEECISETPEGF